MILRAMGLGFVLWLALAALFRFAGQMFFLPDETPRLIAFISAPILGVIVTWLLLKLLHEARGDEGEAAIGIAFPGMLLDTFIVHEFPRLMPNLDPTLDATFGAMALFFHAAILFTGLFMTRLAPQDERI